MGIDNQLFFPFLLFYKVQVWIDPDFLITLWWWLLWARDRKRRLSTERGEVIRFTDCKPGFVKRKDSHLPHTYAMTNIPLPHPSTGEFSYPSLGGGLSITCLSCLWQLVLHQSWEYLSSIVSDSLSFISLLQVFELRDSHLHLSRSIRQKNVNLIKSSIHEISHNLL